MIADLLLLAGLASAVTPTPSPTAPPGPTFCAEWIRQSGEGYDRLTLFRNGVLVWKTSRTDRDEVKRETLEPPERDFYCGFFARQEFWNLPADLRTGLTGGLASSSAVTLARPDGSRKSVRFDDLSSGTAESASLRAGLEGLRNIFLSPLAPASRFAPANLPPGTLLRRFDGAIFRVNRIEKETGFVEIVGVTEPYSQFVKLEELRFGFFAPDPRP